MSIFSIYYSNQKSQDKPRDSVYSTLNSVSPKTPYKQSKSAQGDREGLYNSQMMQKALRESCKMNADIRNNSPTFKMTDTINQSNYQTPIHKSCFKKAQFSNVDSITNPKQNKHISHNSSNDKLMMYREDHFLKKYSSKQREISQEKDWKSSIKTFKQEPRQDSTAKKLRKSVQQVHEGCDPILSPNSKELKRLRMPCPIKFEERKSIEGIKVYRNANSSLGFQDSIKKSKPQQSPVVKVRESNTYKSEVKQIFKESNYQMFSKSDYKGDSNIKKNKKYCIKVDYPRPTSAFLA